MKAHDVAFGIFERRDPTHARPNFCFRQHHRAACFFHFLAGGIDRIHRQVIHERLAWILALHQSAINALLTLVLGLNQKIIHLPRVADLPSKRFLVKLLGAQYIVGGDFEMNNRIRHRKSIATTQQFIVDNKANGACVSRPLHVLLASGAASCSARSCERVCRRLESGDRQVESANARPDLRAPRHALPDGCHIIYFARGPEQV